MTDLIKIHVCATRTRSEVASVEMQISPGLNIATVAQDTANDISNEKWADDPEANNKMEIKVAFIQVWNPKTKHWDTFGPKSKKLAEISHAAAETQP